MSKLIRKTLKVPAVVLARLGIVWPFVFLYARVIRPVRPDGSGGHTRPTLLALTAERFLGDLERLEGTGEFRVLKLPFSWQARLILLFYPPDLPRRQYLQAGTNARVARARKSYRAFLKAFLPRLYRRLGVNCVIGPIAHYVQDLDWGRVSDEIGVPYVVLHKENLVTSPARVRQFAERCHRVGRFGGSHIVTHNETVRDIFVRSGLVAPEKISSLGCLRMDGFVRQLGSAAPGPEGPKRVVFFSFTPEAHLDRLDNMNLGWIKLFEHTHVAFCELARAHPEIDFVIKPKRSERWLPEVYRVLHRHGIVPEESDNLKVLPDADAQELILSADVICGFSSTTLLEAAVAAKPVIVPSYDEAVSPEFHDRVPFQGRLHLFDVAGSPAEFKSLILDRLRDGTVDEACMAARRQAFEELVSSLKGDVKEKYVALLKKVIEDRRNLGRSPAAT